ncbi:ATP-binding protein [Myxococcota bacterium]|nr:ATP-binding protein [Myxococcota bacterium]
MVSTHTHATDAATAAGRATVLVVDDEPHTLSAVAHLLRRRYRVLGAPLAERALELLAVENVHVVLCDQRLPDMPGDRLVAEVRRRYPDTVRLMMTAYWDHAALAYAVNHGQIFGYLRKPWNDEELEQAVESAVAFANLSLENRRINDALRASNERLSRVNAELRHFTHAVAHDLKEPLRTILAYSQFLEEDLGPQVSGDTSHYLEGIGRCAGHLRRLIDDLLQVSELEHVPPAFSGVALDEVLRHVAGLLEGRINERGARLEVAAPLPVVHGDFGRLVLLFQNLVANGLKFNQSEVPVVSITAEGSAAPERAVVRVRDNGIGIAPEHQEKIFHLFQRLHNKSEYPGTGAGLAIVRKIVDSHGGGIRVESGDGKGASFLVELPLGGGAPVA